jgi:hypothetical protein
VGLERKNHNLIHHAVHSVLVICARNKPQKNKLPHKWIHVMTWPVTTVAKEVLILKLMRKMIALAEELLGYVL